MPSTYTDSQKLELMETGANANSWGNVTNSNLETVDAFGAGYLSKDVAGSANVTLTTGNRDKDAESSNKVIEFTGALTGNITVFIPAVENNYIFFNNTSGSFTLTVAPTGHGANGQAIVQGAHTIQYCTGDTVVDLFANSLGTVSVKNVVNVAGTAEVFSNGVVDASTYSGNGSALTNVSTLDSGTQMVFLESTAPTGWTQNTASALANSTLRVITSGTAGTGGTNTFQETFGTSRTTESKDVDVDLSPATVVTTNVAVGAHTLATPEIASHSHPAGGGGSPFPRGGTIPPSTFRHQGTGTNSTGGAGSHTHPLSSATGTISGNTTASGASYTVDSMDLKHANVIVCSKD